MKSFYLISTNHLESGMLFVDNDDFRVGMNIVAICAFITNVKVISFILLSSHLHFVLLCYDDEAKAFIDKYKTLYSRYYFLKYGTREYMRRLKVDIQEVKIPDESFFRAVAYVQMNCVAANLVPSPVLYPWGTGTTFFNATPLQGKALGEMTQSARRKLLKSRVELPGNYIVGDNGHILPCSYVPVRYVESLFKTSKRYSLFLNTSSKARMRLEKDAAPSFNDQTIRSAMTSLIHSLFRQASLKDLDYYQQVELMRQLKRRFSSDISQLSRVSGLSLETVDKMINGFY